MLFLPQLEAVVLFTAAICLHATKLRAVKLVGHESPQVAVELLEPMWVEVEESAPNIAEGYLGRMRRRKVKETRPLPALGFTIVLHALRPRPVCFGCTIKWLANDRIYKRKVAPFFAIRRPPCCILPSVVSCCFVIVVAGSLLLRRGHGQCVCITLARARLLQPWVFHTMESAVEGPEQVTAVVPMAHAELEMLNHDVASTHPSDWNGFRRLRRLWVHGEAQSSYCWQVRSRNQLSLFVLCDAASVGNGSASCPPS